MNIILHIGWHKTGTTSIQEFLKKNSNKLIHENKVYYPDEGLIGCAHHQIAWVLKGQDSSPWGKLDISNDSLLIEKAIESCKKHDCENLIFSSEEFCTFSEKDIIKLHGILKDEINKVTVIIYIRRQDLLIESSYNMEVKWWGRRLSDEFQQYVKNKTPYIKYDVILDKWANVFGLESIKVRLYDTNNMPQNDIRMDFCLATGINPDNLIFDNTRINDSLGPLSLAFLKILNKLAMSREDHEKIVFKLLDRENPSKCVLFDPQERIEFMEHLNASNKKLEKFSINTDLLTVNPDTLMAKNEEILTLEEFSEIFRSAIL